MAAPGDPAVLAEPARRYIVVLNETQDLVNIAGTVRAMSNMGLSRLRLVRPAEFDAWRILGIAHGTEAIVENVEIHDDLPGALADTAHVVGTTARRRSARFVWQHPREAARELWALDAGDAPIALVFGREDVGLTNDQLDLCDRLVTVPTHPGNTSLNLAQAVLLVAYELWVAGPGSERPLPSARKAAPPADFAQQQLMYADVERALEAIDFFKTRNPEAILRTLRAMARRAHLDVQEANLVRALGIEVRKAMARASEADADRGPGSDWGSGSGEEER